MSRRGVTLFAALACLGWLPFLLRPLSPDEGGFLLVASQWAPGTSLYGDYWVDRPPVLIGLFALADGLGDPWALRLLGTAAVLSTVLLSGVVGRLAAPLGRTGALLAAGTAAVFTATPLFGGSVVNSEVLAIPFVLAGLATVVAATSVLHRRATLLLGTAAGTLGMLAALTKQSEIDVFVVALVLVVTTRRPLLLLGVAAGSLGTLAVTLLVTSQLGTAPGDLWHAVVTFRGHAAEVIVASATGTTPRRFAGMLGALAASGAPLVVAGLLLAMRRPTPQGARDLRSPALVLLGWEMFVVIAGGSYWLHYLMGLVPGLVLLAAAAAQRGIEARPGLVIPYVAATLSTLVTIGYVLVVPIDRPEAPVIDFLRAEAAPGDTAVVAFGGANIIRETGMTSPYEDLWSLPVRVRDPALTRLADVLAGADAPTWVVATGDSLATWGVDAGAADRALRDRYEPVGVAGDFTIFRLAR